MQPQYAMDAPKANTGINQKLDDAGFQLDLLVKEAEALVNRLDPILRPSYPEPCAPDNSKGIPAPSESHISTRLTTSTQQIAGVRRQIARIMERLDLPN